MVVFARQKDLGFDSPPPTQLKRTLNMEAMTFKQIYEGLDATPPKTKFIRRIANATMKSEQTVKMWLCGRQTPDALTQSVIAKELGVQQEQLFPIVEHQTA